jgi:hypothetical protein
VIPHVAEERDIPSILTFPTATMRLMKGSQVLRPAEQATTTCEFTSFRGPVACSYLIHPF